jgi:N-acetylneuraminate synthase
VFGLTIIIAEAGVNHNGDKELAFQLIDAANAAGADIVKFQTFKADALVTKEAPQATYQEQNTGKVESQYEMLKRLELDYATHKELIEYCQSLGIEFLSTAFDEESLRFLVEELGLKKLKVPSGELTNAPLVLKHAQTGCDLVISTGMASEDEIRAALAVIAFGYINPNAVPNTSVDFDEAYSSELGQSLLQQKVVLLHCTTEYPAPIDEINLNAMDRMAKVFQLPVGYSDHSEGIEVSVAAAAKQAVLIEKHFTLDRNMEGPDHKASLEPNELTKLVKSVRLIERALGKEIKAPTSSEIKNKIVARKSLVANVDIAAGEVFTERNVVVKRPGNGMSPNQYWGLIGNASSRSYKEGELLSE